MVDIIDELGIFPPLEGTCASCATRHNPSLPHDRNSLYYQVVFYQRNGRLPAWQDAMNHCNDSVKKEWTQKLKESGIELESPIAEADVQTE